MQLEAVPIQFPPDTNVIVGHAHFIKTVEDLYEICATTLPGGRYGIAFSEASGARLVRSEGNDDELRAAAADNARRIGAGHTFVILLRQAFPINVLNAVKQCAEVCTVHCATANPTEILVAATASGRGVVGVVDGQPPLGVEDAAGVVWRKDFLRKIGYKR
ncbi:MAG: adenosine-specific kinase [Candidatus Eisenbacteria bacterium]|nr:adenosine-specific kinase [Candidatus Eisenbacteria bacterium]